MSSFEFLLVSEINHHCITSIYKCHRRLRAYGFGPGFLMIKNNRRYNNQPRRRQDQVVPYKFNKLGHILISYTSRRSIAAITKGREYTRTVAAKEGTECDSLAMNRALKDNSSPVQHSLSFGLNHTP